MKGNDSVIDAVNRDYIERQFGSPHVLASFRSWLSVSSLFTMAVSAQALFISWVTVLSLWCTVHEITFYNRRRFNFFARQRSMDFMWLGQYRSISRNVNHIRRIAVLQSYVLYNITISIGTFYAIPGRMLIWRRFLATHFKIYLRARERDTCKWCCPKRSYELMMTDTVDNDRTNQQVEKVVKK